MKTKYKKNFIRAGQIAKEVRAFGKSLIEKGAVYSNVMDSITKKIYALGAFPAFPPQMALNEVAAHFLPHPKEEIVFSDQLIKLDIGVAFEGAIGDCAVTVDLSGRYQALIDAAEEALLNAEKSLCVGMKIREIGGIIAQTIVARGFNPVRNLAGHGLGEYKVHMPPLIPNYDDRSSAILKPGMTFAIEPFATDGEGAIAEKGEATIFAIKASRPIRFQRTKDLLAKMRLFQGLPFSIHNLIGEDWPVEEVQKELTLLEEIGVIESYPPLVEVRKGWVAQAENSVLIDERGDILVTTR